MHNVTEKTDFRLIYSLGKHPFLGVIIEPHIVYLNKNGTLSLSFQRIFSNTMEDYSSAIDKKDRKIIAILDELEQSNVIKKHYKKHIRPIDYFTKVWNKEVKADRKSTRLNSSHVSISYAVFCLKQQTDGQEEPRRGRV